MTGDVAGDLASDVDRSLIDAVAARGHFRYESGHHGDLWLDLDTLLADAKRTATWAAALAARIEPWSPDVIAGPLTGGAFVAQLTAAELGREFAFVERIETAEGAVHYQVPAPRRAALRGRRIALIDDAVNAGSALLASLADIAACGGVTVGLGSLLAMGDAAARIAEKTGLPFTALATIDRGMWPAGECPLCRSGRPLARE